jgi:glutamate-ammonia-ligase adenylyltransferase
VLTATPGFAATVQAEILIALSRPDAPEKIRRDTVAMRDRLAAELPPRGPFDVKHLPGGMLELSFIAEALQLIHGPADASLFRANTTAALRALEAAGHLPAPDAQALVAADFLWRSIQGIDRITGLADTATDPPAATLIPLLRATNMPDFAALSAAMGQASERVRQCFERHINNDG